MPRVVNKADKRRNIAKSTCELFIKKGFVDVSISEIAINASVGKGTIYEYFKNKEDIVLELMDSFQESYEPSFNLKDSKDSSVKEKILKLFEIFFNKEQSLDKQRKIYRLFLAIHLNSKSKDVEEYYKNFKKKYIEKLIHIVEDSINDNEIKTIGNKLVPSIFATVEGFFIENESEEIEPYIDTICTLINRKS